MDNVPISRGQIISAAMLDMEQAQVLDRRLRFNLVAYSYEYETSTDNAPRGHQDDNWLVNAALRVGPEDGRYELTLLGRNLTDEYYMPNSNGWSGSSNPDQWVGFFNRPREVVLQGTVRF